MSFEYDHWIVYQPGSMIEDLQQRIELAIDVAKHLAEAWLGNTWWTAYPANEWVMVVIRKREVCDDNSTKSKQ